MPMNKYLKGLIAGVVSLVPGKLQAAEPVQQQNSAIVQTAPVTQDLTQRKPVDYSNPSYSEEEVQEKLERLYPYIRGDADWNNSKQIKEFKELLQMMAKYGVGKRIIMEMPEGCPIIYSPFVKDGIDGEYNLIEKNLTIYSLINKFKELLTFGHEARHYIQDMDGRLSKAAPNHFAVENFVTEKVHEIETKLQDIVFESQIKEGTVEEKSAECLFYEAELKRYKNTGLNQQDAERAARTSVVRLYWSGLNDIPEGCSEITPALRDEINSWNNFYDLRAIYRSFDKSKKEVKPFSNETIQEAKKQEELQKKAEQERMTQASSEKTQQQNNIDEIFKKYLYEMDVDLPDNYFTKMQRQRATTGDYFIITEYPDGSPKNVVVILPNGLYKKSLSETGQVMREKQTDKKGKIIHAMSRYPDGKLAYEEGENFERLYYDNGQLKLDVFTDENGDGFSKSFYKSGKIKTEKTVKRNSNGSLKTVGVVKEYHENGQIMKETFYNDDGWSYNFVKEYDTQGRLLCETPYEKGFKHGIQKYYGPDGTVLASNVYNKGKPVGDVIREYGENATLLKEAQCKDGNLNGTTKEYYDDGKIKSISKYKNGFLITKTEYFNENGKIKSKSEWKDGKEKNYKEYYQNGDLKIERSDTEYKEFYENNKIKQKISYNKNGQYDGVGHQWDEQGNESVCIYRNGKQMTPWKLASKTNLKDTLKQFETMLEKRNQKQIHHHGGRGGY